MRVVLGRYQRAVLEKYGKEQLRTGFTCLMAGFLPDRTEGGNILLNQMDFYQFIVIYRTPW